MQCATNDDNLNFVLELRSIRETWNTIEQAVHHTSVVRYLFQLLFVGWGKVDLCDDCFSLCVSTYVLYHLLFLATN